MIMSSIKPKIAPCVDCVEQGDSSPKVLTAKRCQSHYWAYRNSLKKDKPKKSTPSKAQAIKSASNTNLGKWFEHQISICPNNCEECGTRILGNKLQGGFWASALIAHILPKAKNKFPEVATHPLNRMFYCPSCHDKFDNKGNEYRSTMRSLELIKERLREFYPSLTESQQIMALKRLPFTQEELLKK